MFELLIKPLSPALLQDFLTFFDHFAFTDNPDWASCYCQFYLENHAEIDWEKRSAGENRKLAEERICARSMHGYLAFLDDQPIGWVNAALKSMFPSLLSEPELDYSEKDQVGSIVCFTIAPDYRGRGVARALLRAALAGFQNAGLSIAEAYPRRAASTQAANYHGPLSLFEQDGFSVYKDYREWLVVRKKLSVPAT